MAAIGARPFGLRDDGEGFVIVTAAADKGLIDIHDRRPLVLTPDAAREWLRESLSGDEAGRTAKQGRCLLRHSPGIQFPLRSATCGIRGRR